MQVLTPKGCHLKGMLENNINHILRPHLIALAIGLRLFFDKHYTKPKWVLVWPAARPYTLGLDYVPNLIGHGFGGQTLCPWARLSVKRKELKV